MSIIGVYYFKNFEGAAKPVLGEIPVPGKAFIPLEYSLTSFKPLIKKNECIKAGQKLLQTNNEVKMTLVSPVKGIIKDITKKG